MKRFFVLVSLALSMANMSFASSDINPLNEYSCSSISKNDVLNLCNYYENTVVCMDYIANAESLQMMSSYAKQMSDSFAQMYAYSSSLNYPSFSKAILAAKKEADALQKSKTPKIAYPHAQTVFGYINGMSDYIKKLRNQYNIKVHNTAIFRKYNLL